MQHRTLIDKMVDDRDFAVRFLWTIRDLWTQEFKEWIARHQVAAAGREEKSDLRVER